MRVGLWCAWISISSLTLAGCLPLPIQTAPGVEGIVIDSRSGDPVRGAVVVVRFEGRYDDVLPDRDLLGHREAFTDERGRFRIKRLIRPGISAWPLFRTEARVVGVIRDGYRCAEPQWIGIDGAVRISLDRALDSDAQRASCRPLAAERGEAPTYMAAWRGLHPEMAPRGPEPRDSNLERVLESRSDFGFGENCVGPVADLALSPDGRWAAYAALAPGGADVHLLEFADAGLRPARKLGLAENLPPRQLAWSGLDGLVLWEPAAAAHRTASASIFGTHRIETFWRPPTSPASPARGFGDHARPTPLDPEDLTDEADTRWNGRSFWIIHSLDGASGLPIDQLKIRREDGRLDTVSLPGESCGPSGRYGRPHYRIASDGHSGLDLRFVNNGCHVVRIDLDSGEWSQLDAESEPAVCGATRRIPATQMRTALRGYVREIEAAVLSIGADPNAAYVVAIGPEGKTHVVTRDYNGSPRRVAVPDFPIQTPLRRIEVSIIGSVQPGPAGSSTPIASPQPL